MKYEVASQNYLVFDPEHDLLALTQELHKDQGLLQFQALFSQSGKQELPKFVKFIWKIEDQWVKIMMIS